MAKKPKFTNGDDVEKNLGKGSQTISALDGKDTVGGGKGNDVLNGDAGDDILDGGKGNDTLNGGDGNDTLKANNGNDTLDGGIGEDTAEIKGNFKDAQITENGSTVTIVIDGRTITASNVENFKFTDGTVTAVNLINDAPTGVSTAVLAAGAEDTAYIVKASDLLTGFTDANGDTLTIANLTASDGATVVDNKDGTFTITPVANDNGDVTLTFDVTDGTLSTVGTNKFNLVASNDLPTGTSTTVLPAGIEDTAYVVKAADLLAGFSDVDGDTLTVTDLAASGGATVVDNKDGTFTITPVLDFVGTIDLTFKVSDGTGSIAGTNKFNVNSIVPLVLTVGADALNGDNSDNLFLGTETTLSSADVLNGGLGTDTLSYSSSDVPPFNPFIAETGFTTTNIEIFEITADAASGTSFDMTGVTGATTVISDNSSGFLQVEGLKNIVDVEIRNVSDGDTEIYYNDSVLAGLADVQDLTLEGNADNAGDPASGIIIESFGGSTRIETLNIETEGSASALDFVETHAATINITGDQDLWIDFTLEDAKTIDASKFTGDLDIQVDSGAFDVTVTGGTGDDEVDFSNGFATGDKFDGGDGIDTLGLDNATATGAPTGSVTKVEQLAIKDAAIGTVDIDKFAGVTKVIYDGGFAGDAVVKNVGATFAIEIVDGPGFQDVTVDAKADSAADSVTVEFSDVDNWDGVDELDLDDAESVTITADDTSLDASGSIDINNLVIGDATKLTLSGDADINIWDFEGAVLPAKLALATIDASGATGDVELDNLDDVLSETASTITLGSGDDILWGTGLGADTITTGAGKDTIAYDSVAESSGTKVDTITDFAQGSDTLDLSNVGIDVTTQFLGNFGSFGSAQGATTAFDGEIEAVFDSSTNTLWVDSNDDGTLNANDLQVVLKGVTALTAADLNLTSGHTVNLLAPNAVVDSFTKTNADNTTTNASDIINSTAANLVGSQIFGENGDDTLNVTDKLGAFTLDGSVIDDIETVDFKAGTSAAVTISQGDVEDIVVSAGNSTIIVANGNFDIDFTGGIGIDDVTLQSGTYSTDAELDGGSGAAVDILGLVNGTDIADADVESFEQARLAANAQVTMTVAQHAAFTSFATSGANDEINLENDSATQAVVLGVAGIDRYDVFSNGGGGFDLTLADATQRFRGDFASDIIRVNGLVSTSTELDGQGGNDQIVITNGGSIAGATVSSIETADVTGSVTMTATQHQAFVGALGITAAGATDTINIASGAITTITTDADVETYVIGDAAGNAITVNINSATQVISAVAASDDVSFRLDSITSFTGTITGEATTNDELFLDAGDSVVGATINNIEDLTLNGTGTYSMDLADWDAFTGTVTAGNTETVALAGSGTTEADAAVENYILNGAGVNVFSFDQTADATLTDAVRANMQIDLAAGSNTVNIDNGAINAAVDSGISILQFLSGTDKLDIDIGGVNQNSGFQTIIAAGTATTVGQNSVIEIESTVGTAIDLTQVADGGGVEILIASALGNTMGTLTAGQDGTIIVYSGTSAGIYSIDYTAVSANAATNEFAIELIAIVDGVGSNALTSLDFV